MLKVCKQMLYNVMMIMLRDESTGVKKEGVENKNVLDRENFSRDQPLGRKPMARNVISLLYIVPLNA